MLICTPEYSCVIDPTTGIVARCLALPPTATAVRSVVVLSRAAVSESTGWETS
jgi:hypothetical protein